MFAPVGFWMGPMSRWTSPSPVIGGTLKLNGRTVFAAALAVTMLTGACGSRLSHEEIAKAQPSEGGGGQTNGGSGGDSTFGTLDSPCGPGDAKGATDVGVTDEQITVTAVADPGGYIPGLNIGIHHSMQAFEKWCNDQGGINGRKIKVILGDAKLFNYQEVVAQACTDSFALVGGLAVMDNMGAQTQVDCDLVNVPAAAVNAEQTWADITFEPLPNPTDTYPVGSARWILQEYPEAKDSAAALRTGVSTTKIQSDRLIEAYKQLGFDFTYVQDTNLPETNWAPLVLAMKNKNVQFVNFTATYEEIVPMQKEMAQQGFKPAVIELESNYYDVKYPEMAGDVADGTLVRITIWPFEEADLNPATKQFIDIVHKYVPGGEPTLLGVQGWSAALLWAQAVKDMGSEVTRQGLVDRISQVHDWTGGGLHQPTNPGSHKRGECVIMMKVENGGFVRAFPTKENDAETYDAGGGYACLPDAVVPIKADISVGAKKKN